MAEPIDVRVLAGLAMAAPDSEARLSGTVAWFTTPYPGKEAANEDAACLIARGGLGVLAVADGVGGQPAGEQASRAALQTLARSVRSALNEGRELRDGILDGFERANEAVIGLGLGAATTLSVVAIDGHRLRPYHVGDSEILLVGQRGRVKLQIVSHSPVGYAQAAGMLTEKEALHHEDRHIVSNLMGYPDMHIQVGPPLAMARRDTLVLASDGLFDNIRLDEIVSRVRKGPLMPAVAELAELARRRMEEPREGLPSKLDDVSFLVYRRGP